MFPIGYLVKKITVSEAYRLTTAPDDGHQIQMKSGITVYQNAEIEAEHLAAWHPAVG
jgi:hypothetical protein